MGKSILSPADLGISARLIKIELITERSPHMALYPDWTVAIEPHSTLVGDDFGMRVASYPYKEFKLANRRKDVWRFFSLETGDYLMSPAIEGVDYPRGAEIPRAPEER